MRYLLILSSMLLALMLEPIAVSSQADARVGRPLTPFSYAGVARRTYRRGAYGYGYGGYYGHPYHPYRYYHPY